MVLLEVHAKAEIPGGLCRLEINANDRLNKQRLEILVLILSYVNRITNITDDKRRDIALGEVKLCLEEDREKELVVPTLVVSKGRVFRIIVQRLGITESYTKADGNLIVESVAVDNRNAGIVLR